MAGQQKKPSDAGVVSRLAGRGEDAITRLMDELGKNPRVTDALGKAMSAKGKVDDTSRKTLGQIGLAAADEIKELRGRLESLEKRLAKVEGGMAARTARKTQPSRPTPAKRPTAETSRGAGSREKGPSSGGSRSGTARGSSGSAGASGDTGSSDTS